VLAVGDLVLERGRRTVLWRGRRLRLRRRQFDLLVALAAQPGRVLSRADLLIATQSQAGTPRTRTIDVQIGQLRGLLAGCRVTIETVRGRGYRLIDCTAEQSGHGKQNFAPILPELHRPLMVGH
jgi:DNA-binding response OmpR family regulator